MSTSNVTELRNQLLQVFDDLRSGSMDPKDAVEINNTAGKIISTVKMQLANAQLSGTVPNIPFLGDAGAPAKALPASVRSMIADESEAA
jgi:hypothetical protein